MRLLRNRFRLLCDERGLALVLALGVMVVLSASSVVIVDYTTANSSSSAMSREKQSAFTLAEAGINNAMAVLSDPSKNAMSTTLLPSRTSTYQTGSVTWSGVLNQATATWALTSTGTVRNPTRGANLTHTIKANVLIKSRETQPRQNDAWNFVFITQVTGGSCDFSVTPNSTWDAPIYVFGTLCLTNGSKIIGAGPVVAKQKISLNGSTTPPYIGTSSTPVGTVEVGVGCKYLSQHQHPDATHPTHPFCSSVDQVYASTLSNTPRSITVPTVQYDTWYANAIPGPKFGCTYTEGTPPTFDNDSVRNNSISTTQNLTPNGVSYKCRVGPDFSPSSPPYTTEPIGEISWNHTTRTLRVHGTIYIDGTVIVQAPVGSQPFSYDGHGTIYASGMFNITGTDTKLCAIVSGSDCNYSWNRDDESLTIVAANMGLNSAGAVTIANSARLQASIYAGDKLTIGSSAKHEGAIVTPNLSMGSGASVDPFSTISTVPTGTPGTTPVYGEALPPSSFSG